MIERRRNGREGKRQERDGERGVYKTLMTY